MVGSPNISFSSVSLDGTNPFVHLVLKWMRENPLKHIADRVYTAAFTYLEYTISDHISEFSRKS